MIGKRGEIIPPKEDTPWRYVIRITRRKKAHMNPFRFRIKYCWYSQVRILPM